LPWRKPQWFDQRYEFGRWGGRIELLERGAEAQDLPGATDLAAYRQPARGARNMIPTS
jgi:hypothetical protein